MQINKNNGPEPVLHKKIQKYHPIRPKLLSDPFFCPSGDKDNRKTLEATLQGGMSEAGSSSSKLAGQS